MLTLVQAVLQVRANCGASVDPTLDDGEIITILQTTARGTLWGAATEYAYGATVLPTVRNGHRYVVTTGGTSAATEPTWPLTAFSTLTDGTVVLQEAGADYAELYDLKRATWEAFQLKLTKCAATAVPLSTPGGTLGLDKMVENLEKRARRWQPVGVV